MTETKTFRLRAWAEQTLYDCKDYLVDAATRDEAIEKLKAALDLAEEKSPLTTEAPPGIRCLSFTNADGTDHTFDEIRACDPEEVVGGDSGIVEIGKDGKPLAEPNVEKSDAEKLAIAVDALNSIFGGSHPKGRWIDRRGQSPDGGVTLEGEKGGAPDGYYDEDDPPADQRSLVCQADCPDLPDGCANFHDLVLDVVDGVPVWLTPAIWEAYRPEEQVSWLESCANEARRALLAITGKDPA